MLKWRHIDTTSSAEANGKSTHLQLKQTVTGSLPTAAATNEGAIVYDATTNTVKFSDGATWTNVGADAALTLDAAFDNGKTIDGATSAANAFAAGDGSIKGRVYSDATNAAFSSVGGPALHTSAASTDCKIQCGTSNDIKIDVGTANRGVIVGGTTSTDFTLTTANGTVVCDASADSVTFSASTHAMFTGTGTGKGLRIPFHATASPNAQDGTGNIFFEVDGKKLWVYDGTSWVGVVLA